jgi:lysozyme family protein
VPSTRAGHPFDECFAALLRHEGDCVDHSDDPGGKTRFGVTEGVARAAGFDGEMRELQLDLARRIYRERFWAAVRADELPAEVRYLVFDAAVASGVRQSTLWLQRALKARLLAQRLRYMAGLAHWPSFSRGWGRRMADLMEA